MEPLPPLQGAQQRGGTRALHTAAPPSRTFAAAAAAATAAAVPGVTFRVQCECNWTTTVVSDDDFSKARRAHLANCLSARVRQLEAEVQLLRQRGRVEQVAAAPVAVRTQAASAPTSVPIAPGAAAAAAAVPLVPAATTAAPARMAAASGGYATGAAGIDDVEEIPALPSLEQRTIKQEEQDQARARKGASLAPTRAPAAAASSFGLALPIAVAARAPVAVFRTEGENVESEDGAAAVLHSPNRHKRRRSNGTHGSSSGGAAAPALVRLSYAVAAAKAKRSKRSHEFAASAHANQSAGSGTTMEDERRPAAAVLPISTKADTPSADSAADSEEAEDLSSSSRGAPLIVPAPMKRACEHACAEWMRRFGLDDVNLEPRPSAGEPFRPAISVQPPPFSQLENFEYNGYAFEVQLIDGHLYVNLAELLSSLEYKELFQHRPPADLTPHSISDRNRSKTAAAMRWLYFYAYYRWPPGVYSRQLFTDRRGYGPMVVNEVRMRDSTDAARPESGTPWISLLLFNVMLKLHHLRRDVAGPVAQGRTKTLKQRRNALRHALALLFEFERQTKHDCNSVVIERHG